MPRVVALGLSALLVVPATLYGTVPVSAAVTGNAISTAQYPLALDVDDAGNIWIGYANGPDPKGVNVVPAASGTIFGVPVTAGVETQIFALDAIQGILMSPAGQLFVSTDSGSLYVATPTNTTVFGVGTTANNLTTLDTGGPFRGGLAMDSAGNLFGGRKDWNGVAVLPAATDPGGTLYGVNVTVNVASTILNSPDWTGDVAVDSNDNLFIGAWFDAQPGVYVLPKASGTLYGQAVTADTLMRLVPYPNVAGVDIDASDNLYFSPWAANQVVVLTPSGRTLFGQNFVANTPTQLIGSTGDQGVAVSPTASFLVSGGASLVRHVALQAPVVSSVSPSSGPIAGGTSVTISGTDLTGATSVTFGGAAATAFSVVNASTITATTPSGSAGAIDVQVTTAGGTATASSAFTYVNPPPRIPPTAPLNVTAESTLLGARVSWDPPADEGTDSLTLYAVRSWPGARVCQVSANVTSCDATGLDPEVDYYFTVVPMSPAGWGTPSAPSNVVRPLAPRVPGAPTSVVASGGDQRATVSWQAPTDPGTSPVVEYRITSSPDGATCTSSGRSCAISGLTNGVSYTFTVEARNDEGWGALSVASNPVTPASPSLTITIERKGRIVSLMGMSVSIAPESPVQVWARVTGSSEFLPGSALVTVGPDGTFTWQRRLNPAKSISLYVTSDSARSNTEVLPGR